MTRLSGDQWKFPDGRLVVVQPGEIVNGAVLWNGYDYEKQFWVLEGAPVHYALCGKSHNALGDPVENIVCNACEYIKRKGV